MEEIVYDRVSLDGWCELRLIGDRAFSADKLLAKVPLVSRGEAVTSVEETAALSLFYGEVRYPCRQVVEFQGVCGAGRVRRLAVWKFAPGERVSEVIAHVAEWYFASAHRKPGYAFMKKLPRGAEHGQRLELEGYELDLFEADWALAGCVMIGG